MINCCIGTLLKLEIVKLQQELIYKTQSLALETSGSKRPELKLYNDNIIISFIKHDYHIAVKIKDAKLVEYRNMLNSEFRNAIKKYNAKGKEKQKNKELKQLDF